MEEPGEKLKKIRQKLKLSFRDVEEASTRLAARYGSEEYVVALSRLSDIENKSVTPSVYRMYSLCASIAWICRSCCPGIASTSPLSPPTPTS